MIPYLYHATRRSFLDSILARGLQSSFHGRIHGSMDYAPPEKAVYLSRHENSNNLNTRLFDECEPGDEVIVLRIDAALLDPSKFFPDDAFFYILDGEFNSEEREGSIKAFIEQNVDEFAECFGLDTEKARKLFSAFCCPDGSMEKYALIAKKMALEYLVSHGEIAYMGNIQPSAILDLVTHPESPKVYASLDAPFM